MNWIEHLELIEEAGQNKGEDCRVEMPDTLTDAFCIAEQIIGQSWEDLQ